MSEAFFWLFSSTAFVSALGVVFSRQILQSTFWMFAVLLSLSGIFAYLGAFLLAVVTMVVYAGAILVLFTFVTMFIGQKLTPKQVGRWRFLFALFALTIIAVFFAPLFGLSAPPQALAHTSALTSNTRFGVDLFTRYQLITQLAGWLLLWVGVGAINIVGISKRKAL